MTQLPVYYQLPNVIRPNPKTETTSDLHRSSLPIPGISLKKETSLTIIFPQTDATVLAIILLIKGNEGQFLSKSILTT